MSTQIPRDREWLNYKEAQTISGYGRTTLWRLVNSGKIPASKHGRALRISRKGLTAYMWSRVPGDRAVPSDFRPSPSASRR